MIPIQFYSDFDDIRLDEDEDDNDLPWQDTNDDNLKELDELFEHSTHKKLELAFAMTGDE
jgi:hypothetical protein